MKRAHRILSILLAAAMLLPSQALAADIAPKSQTQQSSIVINEVESDAPNKGNDWVEITNLGAAAVDISGWYLTDDKGEERKTEGKTTPLAEGTVLDPGAFLVLEETVNFDFGLGKADKAAIYDAGGNLIVEYEWTTHANGVYARIPANGYLVIYQDDSGAKGFAFGLGKGILFACLRMESSSPQRPGLTEAIPAPPGDCTRMSTAEAIRTHWRLPPGAANKFAGIPDVIAWPGSDDVLWVAADDGYGNRRARITLNGTSDPNVVHVQPAAGVNTSANNEGFAIAGAEYTVSGQRPVYRFCGGVTSGALTIGSMSCNYTASGSGAHHYYPNAAINSPATGDSGAAAKYNGAARGCAVILYSTILLRCVLCRAAGKEKVRQFSRPKAGHSIIKGSKNHCIESKNGSIQLPNSSIFEIHGNIFKPRPSRNPGQTSVVCITHGVLSFCIGKNTLYGLFSYVIELLATFDFSQFFDQIEIFLPDMSCAYPLSAFICATSSFVGTVFADFGRTAASPFPFFACGRMPRPIPHCR